jgi:hypothetical protein
LLLALQLASRRAQTSLRLCGLELTVGVGRCCLLCLLGCGEAKLLLRLACRGLRIAQRSQVLHLLRRQIACGLADVGQRRLLLGGQVACRLGQVAVLSAALHDPRQVCAC